MKINTRKERFITEEQFNNTYVVMMELVGHSAITISVYKKDSIEKELVWTVTAIPEIALQELKFRFNIPQYVNAGNTYKKG